MDPQQITDPTDFIITAEALASMKADSNYADVSDLAGRTVRELLLSLAFSRRNTQDMVIKTVATNDAYNQAQQARARAERRLAEAKAAFKVSLKELLAEPETSAGTPAAAAAPYVFTASNGIELSCAKNGAVQGPNSGKPGWDEAMLELLAADMEAQLYTWRWPADPNIVVIRNQGTDKHGKRWVHAYDVRTLAEGCSWYCSDHSTIDPERNEDLHLACHAYFVAEPLAE